MFIVLLFLKILYNKFLLHHILTVDIVHSQCSSSPYQPLRSDAEALSNEPWKDGDLSRKQTHKAINFNECNFREQGLVKHYSTTVRVMSLNVIGQHINQSYMLKRNVQPFYVNQRMSLVNIPQGRG